VATLGRKALDSGAIPKIQEKFALEPLQVVAKSEISALIREALGEPVLK